jgi:hypothetical protein
LNTLVLGCGKFIPKKDDEKMDKKGATLRLVKKLKEVIKKLEPKLNTATS